MTRRTVVVLLAAGCTPKPIPPPAPVDEPAEPDPSQPDAGDGGDTTAGGDDTGVPTADDTTDDTGATTEPATPVGHSEHLGATSSNHVGYLLGTRLDLLQDMVVRALGSIQDGAGHRVRMGVYADAGGRPGALVLDSGLSEITATGPHEIAVAETHLPAGTWWLLATYGSDSSLYAFPACDSGDETTVFYAEHPADAALPATLSGATYQGQRFSYYLVPRD